MSVSAVRGVLENLWQLICLWHITAEAVILHGYLQEGRLKRRNHLREILIIIMSSAWIFSSFYFRKSILIFLLTGFRKRGLFKGQNYVELAYMTGILPIKKYGEHSAINIFDAREEVFIPNQEISMEFMRAVKVGGWEGYMQALKASEERI